MQLDNTRIAVRQRSVLDTFDLSLHVFRMHGPALIGMFCAGAVPLAVINHFLVGWVIDVDQQAILYGDDGGMVARFLWNMSTLVAVEAPLASVFATGYLGRAMFVVRPQFWQILQDVMRMLPRLAWCQLVMRGLLPLWLLYLTLDRYAEFDFATEFMGVGAIAIYSIGMRLWRPFINEIVLLERNPLIASSRGALTARRRSRQLHGPSSGDLMLRGVVTYSLAICLTISTFATIVFAAGVFLNTWQPGLFMVQAMFPLSMWMVACYLTVVRFLNYLDLRIRQEGWEVELLLRAEGERLTSRLV